MSDERDIRVIPSIDYLAIPDYIAPGMWMVIRVGDSQEILAVADSPMAAMEHARVESTAPDVILTKNPNGYPSAGGL